MVEDVHIWVVGRSLEFEETEQGRENVVVRQLLDSLRLNAR